MPIQHLITISSNLACSISQSNLLLAIYDLFGITNKVISAVCDPEKLVTQNHLSAELLTHDALIKAFKKLEYSNQVNILLELNQHEQIKLLKELSSHKQIEVLMHGKSTLYFSGAYQHELFTSLQAPIELINKDLSLSLKMFGEHDVINSFKALPFQQQHEILEKSFGIIPYYLVEKLMSSIKSNGGSVEYILYKFINDLLYQKTCSDRELAIIKSIISTGIDINLPIKDNSSIKQLFNSVNDDPEFLALKSIVLQKNFLITSFSNKHAFLN